MRHNLDGHLARAKEGLGPDRTLDTPKLDLDPGKGSGPAATDMYLDIRVDQAGHKYLFFPVQFFSDVHLGTKHSRANKLAHALQHTKARCIYWVGDIVDGEYLLKKKHWNIGPWHRQVIAHAFRKADFESESFLIPGNHDEDICYQTVTTGAGQAYHRNLCGKSLGNIQVDESFRYRDPNGHEILVKHGHQYDNALAALGPLGNAALEVLAQVDTWFQRIPKCGGISIAAKGKRIVKKTIDRLWGIREQIAGGVDRDPSLHGIVTGHSHMSEITRTPGGKLQMNDGCCTEHVEFLAQDKNGVWGVVEWHQAYLKITQESVAKDGKLVSSVRTVTFEQLGLQDFSQEPMLIEDEHTKYADRILRLCYRMWPPKDRQQQMKQKDFEATADEVTHSAGYIPLPNPRRDLRQRLGKEFLRPFNLQPERALAV